MKKKRRTDFEQPAQGFPTLIIPVIPITGSKIRISSSRLTKKIKV